MPVVIFSIHATATLHPAALKRFVISYAWFSQWTTSLSTTNITYRHMVPLWGQGWLLHMATSFSPNSRRTPYHVPLSNPSYGGVSLWYGHDQYRTLTHSLPSSMTCIHPTIKFKCDYSLTSIPFLDVNVSLHNGKIVTDLYTKPTDKHQYLLHSSSPPIHTKRANSLQSSS